MLNVRVETFNQVWNNYDSLTMIPEEAALYR